MKTLRKNIIVLFSVLLIFVLTLFSCANTAKNENRFDLNDTIKSDVDNEDNLVKVRISDNKAILTTNDLEVLERISVNDAHEKLGLITDGVYDNYVDFIKIGKYAKFTIIIEVLTGGDNLMYYLTVIKDGKTKMYEDAINITPFWSEPWEGGDYKKKEFEIFEDYLIHIKTEEYSEGDTTRYENYYRISDQGEFYEVK